MTIVEYILDPQNKPRSYHPKTIPAWVSDGGYWMNPDNEKMIGIGVEGDIPDSVTTFTLEELQARQRAVHAKYPMRVGPMDYVKEENGNPDLMTDDEVNATMKDWVDARS